MLTNFVSIFINRVRPLLRKIIDIYRGFRPDIAYSAKTAQRLHEWETALKAWEEVVARSPENLNAHIQRGNIRIRMGRFDEAEAIFQETAKKWPESSYPLAALATLSQSKSDYEQSCERWQTVSNCFPGNLQYRAAYIRSLLNILEFDKAYTLYEDISKKTKDPIFLSTLADIHAARHEWAAAFKIMHSLHESEPNNFRIWEQEAKIRIMGAMRTDNPEYFNQAIELLEKIDKTFPWNLQNLLRLANIYIYTNRDNDANRVIKNIPDTFKNHKKVMELRAWQCHYYENEEGARHIWTRLLEQHYLPVVHSSINSLERIDNNKIKIKPDKILLFSTIRNALWRMPWFLDYYRKLGVDHFFIIDNDSDDGMTEFLLKQKDVSLFWTKDSFGKANSGMRWINELIEQYGTKNWCVYVDADEALVYPGAEKFNLHHLTQYMEKNGHEALFAFMIDMYSHDIRKQVDCLTGKDFHDYYPYFDNSYNFHGNTVCPYKTVISKFRCRLLKLSDVQTKTPLIHGARNIKFLASSHQTTPAIISDVTAVLQHYKMAGDFHSNCLKAVYHETRLPACQHRHLKWAKTLQNLDEDLLFINSSTKRYENSDQLVKLGLMNCPETFLDPT